MTVVKVLRQKGLPPATGSQIRDVIGRLEHQNGRYWPAVLQ